MALHFCRTRHRSVANPSIIRLFSTSTSTSPPPPPPPDPATGEGSASSKSTHSSSLASFFGDVKSSLKTQDPQRTAATDLDSIRKNLSEFRRGPAADAQSQRQSSFQELFKMEGFPKPQDQSITAPGTAATTNRDFSFTAIKDTLKQLSNNTGTNNLGPRIRDRLRMRVDESNTGPRVIGGTSDWLPLAGLNENVKGSSQESGLKTAFERSYSEADLGEKVRKLRPEDRKKEGWFSLTELNERLVKLKEMEQKVKREAGSKGTFHLLNSDLRKSLASIKSSEEEKKTKANRQRLSLLTHFDSTPDFMLEPPKEHLVEKYFHPDNMSSAEKMKSELAKVREEFKMSESDCGSARVQVAQLTTKIKHLSDVLHKKDKHSKKGLQAMVEQRKKLLKYLRRTDWDSYCFVLSKLGLRDNPDYKQSSGIGKKKLMSR